MVKMKRITTFAIAIAALALTSAESGNKAEATPPDDPADVAVVRDKWGAGRVVTDPHGNVTDLSAVPDDLVGDPELQHAISRLHHVRFLGSKGTKGLDLLLGAMASSKTLESTELIGAVSDDALANIEKLQSIGQLTISSSSDRITDGVFRHLGKLSNLNYMCIGSEKPKAQLGINGSGLKYLSGLRKLNELALLDCPIDDAGMKNLKGLSIRRLELRHPAISDRGMEAVSEITSLESVVISNAEITDGAFAHIGRMKNIWCVSLCHCSKITGSGLGGLGNMPKLRCLCLQDCPVTDAAVVNLRGVRLKALNLQLTRITDRAVDDISAIKTLDELYVGETKLTKEAIERLKAIKGLRVDDSQVRKP
jgi:Leucine-rich repeat (LRR) protein